MKIYTSVDLRYNKVQNVNIQTSAPNNPTEGTIYYNPDINRIQYYDGSQWVSVGAEEGGGGGDLNILEHIYVNGRNLTINGKNAKFSLSSTGNGELIVKDATSNYTIDTIKIGGGSEGISAVDFIAAGTLSSGHRTYTIKHNLGTDAVLVQVVDNSGNTVECNVRRYTSSNNHYVEISFAQNTTQNYKLVIIGNPNYSTVTITTD